MNTEKNIKNKLDNYDSPMNMELAWSQLEQRLDGASLPAKTSLFRKFLPFFSIALISLVVGYVTLSETSDDKSDSVAAKLGISKSSIKSSNQGVFSSMLKKEGKVNSEIKKSASTNPIRKTSNETNTVAQEKIIQVEKQIDKQTEIASLNSSSNIKKSVTTTKLPKAIKAVPSGDNIEATKAASVIQEERKTSAPSQKEIKLARLPFQFAAIDFEATERSLAEPTTFAVVSPSIQPKKRKSKLRIGLNLGANRTAFRYSIPDIENDAWLNNRERIEDSYLTNHWGVSLEQKLNSGLKFTTGFHHLDHGLTSTHRDTILTRQRIESETENYVYINQTPAIVTETEIVSTYREDKVKNRHRLSSFQVPIMVGYEVQKNWFDFSLSAGLGINYFYDQTGNWPNTIETSNGALEQPATVYDAGISSNRIMSSGLLEAQLGLSMGPSFRFFFKLDRGFVLGDLYKNGSAYSLNEHANSELYRVSTRLNHRGFKMGVSYIL